MPIAGQLSAIDLNEISGVDEAANNCKGWLVTKSKETEALEGSIEKFLGVAQDMMKRHEALMGALKSSESYLADAPEEVKNAARTLYSYLQGQSEDKDKEPEPEVEAKKATSMVAKFFASLVNKESQPEVQPALSSNHSVTPPPAAEEEVFDAKQFVAKVRELAEKEVAEDGAY